MRVWGKSDSLALPCCIMRQQQEQPPSPQAYCYDKVLKGLPGLIKVLCLSCRFKGLMEAVADGACGTSQSYRLLLSCAAEKGAVKL